MSTTVTIDGATVDAADGRGEAVDDAGPGHSREFAARRILLVVDPFRPSAAAVGLVKAVAEGTGAIIDLVGSVPPRWLPALAISAGILPEQYERHEMEAAESGVRRIVSGLPKHLTVRSWVRLGKSCELAAAASGMDEYDLIVIHGRFSRLPRRGWRMERLRKVTRVALVAPDPR